jgi:protease-4
MGRFLVRALAVVGALTLLVMVGFGILLAVAASHRPTVPAAVILETEFHRGLAERKDQGLFEAFGREKPTVRDVVDALERASNDSRVTLLVSDLSHVNAGLAQLQEVRDAVLAFRKKGKKAIAFADTFGELGPANGAYYLATAYDEIYLQPSGSVGFTGLAMETPFGRELLKQIGVQPSFFKRREYKSAPEMFTEKGPSAPNREQLEALLDSSMSQLVRGVAEARHLEETRVKELVDRAPLLAQESLKEKLVDGLAYRDEVYAKARSVAGDKAEPLYLSRYLDRAGRPHAEGRDKVAVIFGTGNVERGAPGSGDLQGENAMRSGDLATAFRDAVADSHVKAIIFRIDSPGGSYVASDTIRRAVALAHEKGKPVIASMGNVAASGGYFAAMDADKIVAQPGTLTGSIGVFAGKFVTTPLWDKLGVSWATFSRGTNATLMSTTQDFSPQQRDRMNAWLDAVYADFTQKAAEGRHLSLEKLEPFARGRVWTGADAQKRGLVDVLGGFTTALALAKEAAKLAADAPVKVEVFPREKRPFEQLAQLLGGHTSDNSEEETAITPLRWPEPDWVQEGRNAARSLGLLDAEGPLRSGTPKMRW